MSKLKIFTLLPIILVMILSSCTTQTTIAPEVSVKDAYQLVADGAFLLDVRTQEEWSEFHAPQAALIPLDQLPSRLSELPKDNPIVVICRSGNRSATARDYLLEQGFEQVTSVSGGMTQWYQAGYDIVAGE
ncbi:MAG: rhodanese-like domain-containing protein [Anaerolineales bacterium]|nr:rhodanese-like domain-containing protein [Anaerolineales bacterium]